MDYGICLFDLDGTLTDPAVGITKSFQYALASFGIQAEAQSLTGCIGPPLRLSFRERFGLTETDAEAAVLKYREYFSVQGIYENTVYDGIPELLAALKERGKLLAVATNKATEFAVRILEHFGLDGYFSFVSGDTASGSNSASGKKDIILTALRNLDGTGRIPSVMIGDRSYDMTGAREAGIDGIGVGWGYGTREELAAASAGIANTVCGLFHMVT